MFSRAPNAAGAAATAKSSSEFFAACFWVPALYFVQGLPNTFVDQVAPVFLKDLRLDNSLIIAIGAWAYLPWTLKALWAPLVDGVGKKRTWIIATQFALAATMCVLALGIVAAAGTPAFAWLVVIILATMAAISATHDVAADGFYIIALNSGNQALFSGVRSTFFRLATIFGKGGIIALAGVLILATNPTQGAEQSGSLAPEIAKVAWGEIAFGLAIVVAIFAVVHSLILPRPASDMPAVRQRGLLGRNFVATWKSFFAAKHVALLFAVLLLYRLGEVQIATVSTLFFKDAAASGGLGLDNIDLGLLSGTIGTVALLAGGIVAGIAVAWRGLRFWLWGMLFWLNLPDLIYVAFAHWQPTGNVVIGAGILVEQFGYGFGFAGYMLYMIFACREGEHRVAHYAICSGIMALGAMLPKLWTGALLDALGYENFFWWAIACSIPAFFVVARARKFLPADFGKKVA
ncbi:MAG: MFS transporter [Opitutae bacterium]|nr:MFS transporter [Opitutae bacterium]